MQNFNIWEESLKQELAAYLDKYGEQAPKYIPMPFWEILKKSKKLYYINVYAYFQLVMCFFVCLFCFALPLYCTFFLPWLLQFSHCWNNSYNAVLGVPHFRVTVSPPGPQLSHTAPCFVYLTRHIFLFRAKVIYVRSAFWTQDLFEPIMGRTNVLHLIKSKIQLHNVLLRKRIFIKNYCNKRFPNSILESVCGSFHLREWK